MDIKNQAICERIKQIRVIFFAKNNRDFAKKIGIHENTLSNICNGLRSPNISLIQSILLNIKDCSARWLLLGEGDMIERQDCSTGEGRAEERTPQPDTTALSTMCSKISDLSAETARLKADLQRLKTVVSAHIAQEEEAQYSRTSTQQEALMP